MPLQRSVRRVVLQYPETRRCAASPQNVCKHRVAASPRSARLLARLRYESHSRLCGCVSWSRDIINPLKLSATSQRLFQIMVLAAQTAPQPDEVGGRLLNATGRLHFQHTSAFVKSGIHDELFVQGVNIHLQIYASHRADIRRGTSGL